MVRLNEELLRKRSEHNEGLLVDLEEIALHQFEIERIESVGTLCCRLKILLLQNNIIGKIENLHKLKELEYLNLAINNIVVIENLNKCESLKKLDLTLNFIDFDTLGASLSNLESNYNLKDLYLIGNPVSFGWEDYRECVISFLPQLNQLDGNIISRTERIEAVSKKNVLLASLELKASSVRDLKRRGEYVEGAYTRESRVEMCRELAQEKSEKSKTEKVVKTIPSILNHQGEIRQCNEGKYKIDLQEEKNDLIIQFFLPKYLDSSLISVDITSEYLRVIVKNKLTQLRFDSVIFADTAKVVRSRTTGVLRVEATKLNDKIIEELGWELI